MRIVLIAVTCLVLTGCVTTPVVIKEPVEVKVLVKVPCVERLPEKPIFALDDPSLKSRGLYEKGVAMLREIEQRRDYEKQLEAELEACKMPAKETTQED